MRSEQHDGFQELRDRRKESRGLFWAVGVFGFFANILLLTGPLYMLQVYDRVLGSRSEETLIALSVLVVFLFVIMGILDFTRGRIMARAGARFVEKLDQRVLEASSRQSSTGATASAGMRDLDAVHRLMTSPVLTALFDIPWTPIFLVAIGVFHPWLGALALTGGAFLVGVTVLNQIVTRHATNDATKAAAKAERMAVRLVDQSEAVCALGMGVDTRTRWGIARSEALERTATLADTSGGFSAFTKAFRMALQSAMLGLGAWLVLRGELTPGAMIAGSILMGRALAPVEQAIGQWPVLQRGVQGWRALGKLLSEVPPQEARTPLPVPRARLSANQLTVLPPGETHAALRAVTFEVREGECVGVIGQSGAGKSTLARALVGLWRPAGGAVRLDGATLDQYDAAALGRYVGYLPQNVQLFDGTISENIARMAVEPDWDRVVEAAKIADAHDMILNLPKGYDTLVSQDGGRLSGGQIQRIGLARALYSDPVVLILDEPNSNLDNSGSEALNAAIRSMKAKKRAVLIMAHRPAAIKECQKLLVIDNGLVAAFGPRDEVLRKTVSNYQDILSSDGSKGGVQ